MDGQNQLSEITKRPRRTGHLLYLHVAAVLLDTKDWSGFAAPELNPADGPGVVPAHPGCRIRCADVGVSTAVLCACHLLQVMV
ncbi:hypothetical protein [Rhodococcus koreensis]|uniref:hypothetical protein n=1 Tax=Rhodococcus koreensis TaxID=99653 RepID=UPI00366FCBAA